MLSDGDFVAREPIIGAELALALSLLVLALGPALHALARRVHWALVATDGFMLAGVGGLALVHVGPEALEAGGGWAVLALAVGLASPAFLERTAAAGSAERLTLAAAIAGLALHAALDGAALAHAAETGALALAIVLHRLPEGILVWWVARPGFGVAGAVGAVVAVGIATAGGFAAGQHIAFADAALLGIFEAFVTGALLHVLVGHGPGLSLGGQPLQPGLRIAEIAGSAAGIALVVIVGRISGHAHPQGSAGELDTFRSLALDSAVPLLSGYAIAAAAATSSPDLSPRAQPVLRGLLRAFTSPLRGAAIPRAIESSSATATEASGAPALAIEGLLVAIAILGLPLALVTYTCAAITTFAAGLAAGPGPETSRDHHPSRPAFLHAAREIIDHTGGWLLVGLGLAAIIHTSGARWLEGVPAAAAVPAFVLAAAPFHLGAAGAIPLAAAFIAAGVSPGAAIAFIIAGSATSLALARAIAAAQGRLAAVRHTAAVLASALCFGWLISALPLDPARAILAPVPLPALAAAAVALLFLTSLVRLGPRRFLQP